MAVGKNRKRNLAIVGGIALLGLIALGSRRRTRPGELKNYGADRLGEFFTLDEFIRSDVAEQYDIQEQFQPNTDHIIWGMKLAQWVLDPVRRTLDGPVIVNSWYRSQELQNQLIALGFPAAEISRHRFGGAADVEFYLDGENRNDLLVRAVLSSNVPFDRMLIEHGTLERPGWIQLEYNGAEPWEKQEGKIMVIPSGISGYEVSRQWAEEFYL